MGRAIKHPLPDRVICNFWHPDTLTLSPECQSARMSKNYKWRLNPVWHRMLYSCTQMATVCIKGLIVSAVTQTFTCAAVRPVVVATAPVLWGWRTGRHVLLWTVVGVVKIKHITDVTEQSRRRQPWRVPTIHTDMRQFLRKSPQSSFLCW